MSPRRTSNKPSADNGMTEPSSLTPARVTVKPPAVNTNWLFTRVVFALVVLPPMVAAPAADAVFTNDGGTTCFFGATVVVGTTVVVVVGVAFGVVIAVDAARAIVVVVDGTLLSTNVNSVVTT